MSDKVVEVIRYCKRHGYREMIDKESDDYNIYIILYYFFRFYPEYKESFNEIKFLKSCGELGKVGKMECVYLHDVIEVVKKLEEKVE